MCRKKKWEKKLKKSLKNVKKTKIRRKKIKIIKKKKENLRKNLKKIHALGETGCLSNLYYLLAASSIHFLNSPHFLEYSQ